MNMNNILDKILYTSFPFTNLVLMEIWLYDLNEFYNMCPCHWSRLTFWHICLVWLCGGLRDRGRFGILGCWYIYTKFRSRCTKLRIFQNCAFFRKIERYIIGSNVYMIARNHMSLLIFENIASTFSILHFHWIPFLGSVIKKSYITTNWYVW